MEETAATSATEIAKQAANQIITVGGPWAAAFLLVGVLFVVFAFLVWQDLRKDRRDGLAREAAKDAAFIESLRQSKVDAEKYGEQAAAMATKMAEATERFENIMELVREVAKK